VLATRNAGKVREVTAILAELGLQIEALDANVVLPEEGDGYEANAVAKALAAARATGCIALGDDSGLEVDALGGAPGPLSARYGGPGLDDTARTAALLDALAAVPDPERSARFVCVAAAVASVTTRSSRSERRRWRSCPPPRRTRAPTAAAPSAR
jgi:XTP/dITP diphosphohydrolase